MNDRPEHVNTKLYSFACPALTGLGERESPN